MRYLMIVLLLVFVFGCKEKVNLHGGPSIPCACVIEKDCPKEALNPSQNHVCPKGLVCCEDARYSCVKPANCSYDNYYIDTTINCVEGYVACVDKSVKPK